MEKRHGGEESPRYSLDSGVDVETRHLIEEKQPDLESQLPPKQDGQNLPERAASRSKVAMYLATYFLMNISLTLYNKKVLGSFHFPWILTAVHTGLASLGSYGVLQLGYFELTSLSWREHYVLFMFSLLFTLNIAMSNLSLAMVSIPFHQIMRATSPVFTILIFRVFFARRYSLAIYASIIPVIVGVGLSTFGDYYFSALGFTLSLAGVILASIKTVVVNRLMTGRLRLTVYEVLLRMGPLAAVQSILYSVVTGEFGEFLSYVQAGDLGTRSLLAVAGNGILAFALNVVSFNTNKLAGALSITICANLKQSCTIMLGAVLWNVPMSLLNVEGIMLTVAGVAWYSSVEFREKRSSG